MIHKHVLGTPEALEESIQSRLMKCRHFTGIMNKSCAAGVTYDSLPRPLPCVPNYGQCPGECAKREFPTRVEAEKDAKAFEAAALAFLAKVREGKVCPHCDTPIVSRVIVGRCEYLKPCGHRLGQVDPKARRKALAAAPKTEGGK